MHHFQNDVTNNHGEGFTWFDLQLDNNKSDVRGSPNIWSCISSIMSFIHIIAILSIVSHVIGSFNVTVITPQTALVQWWLNHSQNIEIVFRGEGDR